MDKGWKPNVEMSPNCPRCGSSTTKFCYYNNYSSTQPRYFCKGCRRYWTKGGALRDVPVGGGCRRSRRGNKTLRQSMDSVVEHAGDLGRNSSSNSSVACDGPNIDLAQVYANFLNQKPDSTPGLDEKPDDQMKTAIEPTLEYSSPSNTDVGPNTTWPEEFGLSGSLDFYEESTKSHFSEGNVQMYFCGFNSIQEHQEYRIDQFSNHDTTNFELPPLPGEEAFSHDMLRSDSEMMINHALQATQLPLFGPEAHDADFLVGNWSPFDFPRDVSFSSP